MFHSISPREYGGSEDNLKSDFLTSHISFALFTPFGLSLMGAYSLFQNEAKFSVCKIHRQCQNDSHQFSISNRTSLNLEKKN